MNLTDQHNMTDSAAGLEPAISVVMPAYNAERYLDQAIQSILDQDFQNFEFIIIDDASTDNTLSILNAFATKDQRIKIHCNVENLGVAESLNLGFKMARGRYIARMDADDISLPQRFSKQAAFLDANSDFAFVGTGYQIINADGRITRTDIEATEAWECEWMSIFRMPVIHPSMMIRASIVQQNRISYDESYKAAQDIKFTQDLLQYGSGRCLPIVAFQYRKHENNVSNKKRSTQIEARLRAVTNNAMECFPSIEHDKVFHLFSFLVSPKKAHHSIPSLIDTMQIIENEFRQKRHLDSEQVKRINTLSSRWIAIGALNSLQLRNPKNTISFLWHSRAYARAYLSEAISYFSRRIQRG